MKINKGFTLLEMLVVIGIIAILVTLGFASYATVQKSSRDLKRKADLEQVRSALEMYRSNHDKYPNGSWSALSVLTSSSEKYLESLPTDPKNPTYTYYYSGLDTDYTLASYLETGTASCGVSCTGANCTYCMGPYGVDEAALPTSTPVPTTPPASCTTVCVSSGFTVGTCRSSSGSCFTNGETYAPSGNVYCTGGASADTCCCR